MMRSAGDSLFSTGLGAAANHPRSTWVESGSVAMVIRHGRLVEIDVCDRESYEDEMALVIVEGRLGWMYVDDSFWL